MDKLSFIRSVIKMSKSGLVNRFLIRKMDSFLYDKIVNHDPLNVEEVRIRKFQFISSMLHMAMKNVRKGYISPGIIERLAEVLIENSFFKESAEIVNKRKIFFEEHGYQAPSFITLSPTGNCNLSCQGCYAGSDRNGSASLPWETVDRIVADVHDSFGAHFITISGGEPFMYNDGGHTIFDIFSKYDDMFFLIYTNGTLISREVAAKIAKTGNATPAISVEGFEKDTDERRGPGTHSRILRSFENLRSEGVPFGISVTATSRNIDSLLGENFYEYYFEELGATYMWQFQFLPIGRGNNAFNLVVNPDNRVKLYNMWEKQLSENKRCIADFWNSGMITCGCIAYGGNHGYIYINWDGNIMPCVFVPYYIDNIKDLYKKNLGLTDALNSEFMKRGREWQNEYGLSHQKTAGNWLMPCSFRDHYKNFVENILTDDARPENPEAAEIMNNRDYFEKMNNYDMELKELTEPIWKYKYMKEAAPGLIKSQINKI